MIARPEECQGYARCEASKTASTGCRPIFQAASPERTAWRHELALDESFTTIRCMNYEIVGEITRAETIARGSGIRELRRLRKVHGQGNWRKRK